MTALSMGRMYPEVNPGALPAGAFPALNSERILGRRGELGVFVEDDQLHFRPLLLRRDEFLREPADFFSFDVSGTRRRLRLRPGSLAFTCCQTPFVYQPGCSSVASTLRADGTQLRAEALCLDPSPSRSLLSRDGRIRRVTVTLADIRGADLDKRKAGE